MGGVPNRTRRLPGAGCRARLRSLPLRCRHSTPGYRVMPAQPAVRPTSADRIRAARWFAEHGFGVFSCWSATAVGVCRCPKGTLCDSPGKHPITTNGFQDATTDPERIGTMLSAASEPNYGLVCPDGVFALDVDGDGTGQLAELEARLRALPPSLRTATSNR